MHVHKIMHGNPWQNKHQEFLLLNIILQLIKILLVFIKQRLGRKVSETLVFQGFLSYFYCNNNAFKTKLHSIFMSRIFASFLVLFAISLLSEGKAQTIELGSGTADQYQLSSGPVNIYFRRTVCQFVYTQSELAAAGASSISPITELGFYITGAPANNLPNYTIKIKHTSATDVSAALGLTGWTTVKNGFTYAPTAGDWDMLTLDNQTFVWDGISSIGVEVCWSAVSAWSPSGQSRIYSTTNGYRFSWTDMNGSSCGSTPTTVNSNKPQIRIVFVPGTSTTWIGAVDSDWFNQNNWSAGVPSKSMDAVVPATTIFQPIITGSDATTKSISVETGATLGISGSETLNIYGDWLMDGLFTGSRSTVRFKGVSSGPNQMNGANNQLFNNLEIRSDAGVTLNSGTYEILGSLRLKGGNFTSNNLVTLESNSFATGRMTAVRNLCQYELIMRDAFGDGWDGGTIRIDIDGAEYGIFNAEGLGSTEVINIPNGSTYELTYSAGLYENENSYRFNDPLGNMEFNDGPTPTQGLVHAGVATCAFNSPFVGEIAIQRYLEMTNQGWREISSGVLNQTLSEWQNDGIIMTGFSGSDYPGFGWTSVYTYDENNADGDKNNGWSSAVSIADNIDFNHGHRVYIGAVTRTLEVSGSPVVGTQSIALDFQDDAGASDQEGWNLIGNPYVCSVDWDNISSFSKEAIDNALWIWNATAANYGLYVGGTGGFGTNGVGANIASSQAFWVHANDINPSLTFTEDDKTEIDARFVKSIGHQSKLRIHLSSAVNTFYDEAILVWRDDASIDVDDKDGSKLYSPEETAPSLSFDLGAQDYSINAIHSNSAHYSTFLKAYAGETGIHTMNFEGIELLEEIPCLILEDMVLDSLVDLHQDSTYEFLLSELYTGTRFKLHTGQWYNGDKWERCEYLPEQTIQEELALNIEDQNLENALIYPNPVDDFIHIDLPEEWDNSNKLDVLSVTGQVLLTYQIIDKISLNVQELSAGTYILKITDNSGKFCMKPFIKN